MDVAAWITANLPRRHPPEQSDDGVIRAAVSQPLPVLGEEEALRAMYLLADFGCAMYSNLHNNHQITTVPLRAPEVFLGGKWDKPADIWSFGCLVYKLVAARHLFTYKRNAKWGLSETKNMLYKMMLFSGKVFCPAQLAVCPRAIKYFNPADCSLKKNPKVFKWPLKHRIGMVNTVPTDEIPGLAAFVRRCLRLDPSNRASVQELLGDAWLRGAGGVSWMRE